MAGQTAPAVFTISAFGPALTATARTPEPGDGRAAGLGRALLAQAERLGLAGTAPAQVGSEVWAWSDDPSMNAVAVCNAEFDVCPATAEVADLVLMAESVAAL